MAYAQIGSFVLFKFTNAGFSNDLAGSRSNFATEATFIVCIFECLAFVMQVFAAANCDHDFDNTSCVEIHSQRNKCQPFFKGFG